MSPASPRPALHALARRLGIADGYRSALDESWVETSDETRIALLDAMGVAAGSEAEARRGLASLDAEEAVHWLAPVRVVPAPSAAGAGLGLERPPPLGGPFEWRLELRLEGGACLEREGRGDAARLAAEPLPGPLPEGAHVLALALAAGGRSVRATQRLFVVPARAFAPEERVGDRDVFGLVAQLYTLRSRRGWGAGDFGDLARLVDLAGERGAAFVGLNPLHALAQRGDRVSPYSPVSRLFRDPLYIEIEAVPEWADCPDARRLAARRPGADAWGPRIDAPAVLATKRPVLERLHAAFRERERGTTSARGRAFAAYRAREGEVLERFATFLALADHFEAAAAPGVDPFDTGTWPAAFRDPDASAVTAFRTERSDAVAFHAWCQFELDRQLGACAERAARSGLALGLYTDLALGSAPGGFDAWAFPGLFARASAGAPPDEFSRDGQDWGFPPFDPRALRADGYAFWLRLLRASFAHAGALRIDHVLGLRRLYWVPRGRPAREGAYVAYPEADLLGLLSLESRRHAAAVIGEDLGTVPEGFSESLHDRGVLSSRVLLFERHGERFHPAEAYPRDALTTATTHDLPPLAAWLGDEDLPLRRRSGQIPDDAALERERHGRESLRAALREALREEGAAAGGAGDPLASVERFAAAVTAFLCRTPSRLVGLAVDDLLGESEPVNLPGVPNHRHPSWTRALPIDALPEHPVARACFAAVPAARRWPQTASSESSTRGRSTDRTTSGHA